MDAWITALFGLLGTAVGAAVTWATTLYGQRRQDERAKEERVAAQEQIALDALTRPMWDVIQHTRGLPTYDQDLIRWNNQAEKAWEEAVDDILGPASIHVEAIRDPAYRARITEAIDQIDRWSYAYRHHRTHPRYLIPELARHVTACLGAYRRNEPLPAEPKALTDAREAWEWEQEVSEIEAAAHAESVAEERARRAAERAAQQAEQNTEPDAAG
ncbi:hypothetical protein [Streptomyces sp. NPDC056707]|uniref:hypothetical protein n=1 Tax=Streptomyces sp. NPDC056707 TaxID=3345919 RepID=UPI0036902206